MDNDTESLDLPELELRMREGDQEALGLVFSHYRERLKKIASFRLDHRLAGRVSDSDVLQEAFIASAKRLEHFGNQSIHSAFIWFRMVLSQQITDLYRQHVSANKRDARREIRLTAGHVSPHTSMAIAAQLVQRMTAVSEIVSRAEEIERLEKVLNAMDETDREIIALRHFEELSNGEAADILGLEKSTASKRYVRAMKRLAELMSEFEKDADA